MAKREQYLDAILAELKQGHRQWRRGDKLLEAFGYTRRRQTAINLINSELDDRDIYASPRLTTSMPLDRAITFYLKGTKPGDPSGAVCATPEDAPVEVVEVAVDDEGPEVEATTVTIAAEPPTADPGNPADRSLIVGNLACADRAPEQIKPAATVEQALTIMALRDYSQLVVATGPRDIKGIVSYKSVAQAFLHGSPKRVADCIDRSVPKVELSEPLLRVVHLFNQHDAVLIVAPDKTLAGIVTPADISAEFGAMAALFLLIGEIEEQLRWLVQKSLDLSSALAAVGNPVEASNPPSGSDLTMGELHRILEHPTHWEEVGIRFDRATFCIELNAVREIRNAVMHFRDYQKDELVRLERFAVVVKTAYLAKVA